VMKFGFVMEFRPSPTGKGQENEANAEW
jgi:hypothetical protein